MSRIRLLQERMQVDQVDHAVFSVGPDLAYLTGYTSAPSERVTALSVPVQGDPVLFVPQLEASKVPPGIAEVVAWGELDDPISMLAQRCRGADRIAIGDHMWSAFLIRLLPHVAAGGLIVGSELTRHLRSVKAEDEVDALRRAARAVDRVLARVPSEVPFSGRTEAEVAEGLRRMTVEEGHDAAEFAIVASGPNSASPHHEPGARVIGPGDVVVCDFGGSLDRYYSDVTRTFSVGDPSAEAIGAHAAVHAANREAVDRVRPGIACQELDRSARGVIEEAGFGDWFIHRTGHGIGMEVHEHPYIVEGNQEELVAGMSFSIEPGVYLPGQFGVRIEDIVVCAPSGVEVLNQADRDLVVVQ